MSYITIRGSGFNDISEVWVGQGKANTWSVNPNFNEIYAQVPIDATSGRIRLISARRQKTGISQSSGFWAIPKLTKYLTTTFDVMPGAYIHLDGYHMNGITGATINNLTLTTAPSIVNNNRVLLVAPSGNCRGLFRVWSTGNIRVTSNFSYDPNIPITGVNKTGFLTGDFILVTGRNWIPELMFSAGGNNYYGRIGDNGERMQFTRTDYQTLSGTVTTGAQNGTVYIEREDGYSYANQNIKVQIYRQPESTGGFIDRKTIYWPEAATIVGNNLNYVTGIQIQHDTYLGDLGSIDWQPFTGAQVNFDGTKINIPTTGIPYNYISYIETNAITNEYAMFRLLYRGGQIDITNTTSFPAAGPFAFNLRESRGSGINSATNLYFTGNSINSNGSFFTGSGLVQRRLGLLGSAPRGWWVEYRLSGISGFNWYATGVSLTGLAVNDQNGYGLQRIFRINANNTRSIYLGATGWPTVGSGLLRTNQYSGLATGFYSFPYTFICEDGFTSGMSGIIAIRP